MPDNQGKIVPALRFPKFSGEWEVYKLGEIASFSKGKGIAKSNISDNGNTECIRYGELYTHYHEVIRNIASRTNVSVCGLVLSKKNDIIIPASGESEIDIATAACVLKDGVALGGDINIIRLDEDGIFVSYYLNNARKKEIARLAQGVSVVHLYSSQLKTLKLLLPNRDEQQKIADFLKAVDEKIRQLIEKKALLKDYKKGMMQQIFSQKIRFLDDNGNSFPDWKTLSLSRFLVPDFREIVKPNTSYLAIGVRSHCKGTFQKPDFDPDSIAMKKLYVVKEKDLIVNITFAWEGAIALAKKEDQGGLVSHRFPTYIFKCDLVLPEYFQYVFTQKRFRFMLDLISPGGAGRNRVLSKKEFLKLKWLIPSLSEQQKIADFLTALDKKIEVVQNQLTLAQEFKKGLLQQMFV